MSAFTDIPANRIGMYRRRRRGTRRTYRAGFTAKKGEQHVAYLPKSY
jgi:hypothetical protein